MHEGYFLLNRIFLTSNGISSALLHQRGFLNTKESFKFFPIICQWRPRKKYLYLEKKPFSSLNDGESISTSHTVYSTGKRRTLGWLSDTFSLHQSLILNQRRQAAHVYLSLYMILSRLSPMIFRAIKIAESTFDRIYFVLFHSK